MKSKDKNTEETGYLVVELVSGRPDRTRIITLPATAQTIMGALRDAGSAPSLLGLAKMHCFSEAEEHGNSMLEAWITKKDDNSADPTASLQRLMTSAEPTSDLMFRAKDGVALKAAVETIAGVPGPGFLVVKRRAGRRAFSARHPVDAQTIRAMTADLVGDVFVDFDIGDRRIEALLAAYGPAKIGVWIIRPGDSDIPDPEVKLSRLLVYGSVEPRFIFEAEKGGIAERNVSSLAALSKAIAKTTGGGESPPRYLVLTNGSRTHWSIHHLPATRLQLARFLFLSASRILKSAAPAAGADGAHADGNVDLHGWVVCGEWHATPETVRETQDVLHQMIERRETASAEMIIPLSTLDAIPKAVDALIDDLKRRFPTMPRYVGSQMHRPSGTKVLEVFSDWLFQHDAERDRFAASAGYGPEGAHICFMDLSY